MSEIAELQRQITELFELMNVEVPTNDTDLFETGILDSLTFVQLMLNLEERLGVVISLDELEPENFRSIQQIASFVRSSQIPPRAIVRGNHR